MAPQWTSYVYKIDTAAVDYVAGLSTHPGLAQLVDKEGRPVLTGFLGSGNSSG